LHGNARRLRFARKISRSPIAAPRASSGELQYCKVDAKQNEHRADADPFRPAAACQPRAVGGTGCNNGVSR
jgi:hypothetical protein